MHDAGAFAQDFDRAGFGAAAAKDVGVEDAKGGAAKVPGADALNESRDINMSRTRGCTGGIKTVQTTIRLNDGSLRRKRRLDISKPLSQQKIVRDGCGTHEDLGKLRVLWPAAL